MHLIEPIRECIDDIVRDTGTGLKSLLLDEFTTGVIGAGYARSDMLLREVFVFESIDTISDSAERLNHMKCIVILRPTKDNVDKFCSELARPHYRTYHLYFTYRIGPTLIKRIAEADETEAVRCIRELPLDFQPVTPFLFTLKIKSRIFNVKDEIWHPEALRRATYGLTSALIALKMHPLIRYQTQSTICKVLAEKVSSMMTSESIANKTWRKAAPFDVNSLLIIIDRRNDLLTPLVNKWTYHSMIHEQFNIENNRVNLTSIPNRQPKDPREMVISTENDHFFAENFHKNYGELGTILKEAVEDLKRTSKSQHKVETMEDMKRFIDEYPETRRYAANLHNHVFLMSELTRIVTEHNLIELSECEQELAYSLGSHSEITKRIKQLISSSSVRPLDALRLVSIYLICKPSERSTLKELVKLLKSRPDLQAKDLELIDRLNIFNLSLPQNPLDDTVQQVTRMIIQGVRGVENVLTQHKPGLYKILEDLTRVNKLKESEFAFFGERYREDPPKKIFVFMVGGVTYDEASVVDQFNRSLIGSVQIVLGGTSIHNFESFIEEVVQSIEL